MITVRRNPYFPGQSYVHKILLWKQNNPKDNLHLRAGVEKSAETHQKDRKKKDRVASNIHSFATLETGATSQTLPYYSDV
jgi:hypothetical protein